MKISTKKNVYARVFLILLALLIVVSAFMSGVASEWGYVKIERIYVVGDDGLTYSALMMTPKTATNENPAPVFIPCHGGSADARAMEVWGLELARRGYVVLIPDAAGGGASEKYSVTDRNEKYNYIYEPVYTMFNYLMTLPIVQKDNVHVAGISQGGNSAKYLAEDFPDQVKSVSIVASSQFITYDCNVLFMQGIQDTVCQAGKEGPFVDGWYADLWKQFESFGVTCNDEVEIGKLYGSYEDGTARMFKMNNMSHAAGTFNHECISSITDFVMNSTGIENVPNYIDADNSCWEMREILGLVAFLLICVLVPIAAMMFIEQVPFFGTIRQDMPKAIGLEKGGWWFSAIMALVVPMAVWSIKAISSSRVSNSIWPAYHLNKSIRWLCVLTVFGLVMFFVYHFVWGKKHGGNLALYGITYGGEKKIRLSLVGKALLLSVFVEGIVLLLLHLIEKFTGLTPHMWYLNYSPLVFNRLKNIPSYWIIYVIAFLLSALSMNVERRLPDTGNVVRDDVRAVAINVVLAAGGIAFLFIIQKLFGYNNMTLPGVTNSLCNILDHSQFGLYVNIGVAAGINTYLYRKTGTIWSGAFTAAILTGVNAVMNNCI